MVFHATTKQKEDPLVKQIHFPVLKCNRSCLVCVNGLKILRRVIQKLDSYTSYILVMPNPRAHANTADPDGE